MKPKLLFVEGLPNSGKSTAVGILTDLLQSEGVPAEPMFETDLDNRLDNHCNAFLSPDELHDLSDAYEDESSTLAELAEPFAGGFLVRYLKHSHRISKGLFSKLSGYDFYELPILENFRLVDEMWRRFLSETKGDPYTYVIECAVLQNPTHICLIRDNLPSTRLESRVAEIMKAVTGLPCALFYIRNENLLHERCRRSPGWSESNIRFFTYGNEYGKDRGLSGLQGVETAFKEISAIHESIVSDLACPTYVVDNSDYDKSILSGTLKAGLDALLKADT